MRVAVSKRGNYNADIYCNDGNSAKKILNEHSVSILAIDFYLNGRHNGKVILEWAREKNLLPRFVVITESDRDKRVLLALTLTRSGYRTADGTTFIKGH
ncbi:hypothetical protein KCM76_10685 [Zooshikella marina]|uniref:hypothetical protein n=1 Tax=Zooshikella ganghwensis TaxID=202772 RepID=UPI00042835E8|nr:hypothetical protein [Zooshikella ganghwensis]MBU2706456.1 hypothetical protein [Zooshikella ganghwensis]